MNEIFLALANVERIEIKAAETKATGGNEDWTLREVVFHLRDGRSLNLIASGRTGIPVKLPKGLNTDV